MKRRLLTILSALSLLLFVAVGVLWVQSYWVIDRVSFASARLYRVVSGGGGVFVESLRVYRHKRSWRDAAVVPTRSTVDYSEWYRKPPQPPPPTSGPWKHDVRLYGRAALVQDAWGADLNLAVPDLAWIAVARQNTFDNADGTVTSDSLYGPRVWVPYWLVAALAAALPAWHVVTFVRRSRRRALNLCAACGYDLRATPERCPECGAARQRLPHETAPPTRCGARAAPSGGDGNPAGRVEWEGQRGSMDRDERRLDYARSEVTPGRRMVRYGVVGGLLGALAAASILCAARCWL